MDEAVLASYMDGVEAIGRLALEFGPSDWLESSGCDGWSALDLAGHLLVVANWWHEWLDRAAAGDSSPPFHWNDLPRRNAEALEALPPTSGPDRVAAFSERALSYVERARRAWDLPFGCPPATVSKVDMTVGLHFRIAPAEWHLHAADLAHAIGRPYRPRLPGLVLEGLQAVFPLPAPQGDAWEFVLLSSGRHKQISDPA